MQTIIGADILQLNPKLSSVLLPDTYALCDDQGNMGSAFTVRSGIIASRNSARVILQNNGHATRLTHEQPILALPENGGPWSGYFDGVDAALYISNYQADTLQSFARTFAKKPLGFKPAITQLANTASASSVTCSVAATLRDYTPYVVQSNDVLFWGQAAASEALVNAPTTALAAAASGPVISATGAGYTGVNVRLNLTALTTGSVYKATFTVSGQIKDVDGSTVNTTTTFVMVFIANGTTGIVQFEAYFLNSVGVPTVQVTNSGANAFTALQLVSWWTKGHMQDKQYTPISTDPGLLGCVDGPTVFDTFGRPVRNIPAAFGHQKGNCFVPAPTPSSAKAGCS